MKPKKFDITGGQIVWLRPTGNYKRNWNGEPVRGRIFKIARKYFYVSVNGHTWSDEKFSKEDFVCDDHDGHGGYEIYESLEAFRKAVEYDVKLAEIRRYFSGHVSEPLPYDAVNMIHTILSFEDAI